MVRAKSCFPRVLRTPQNLHLTFRMCAHGIVPGSLAPSDTRAIDVAMGARASVPMGPGLNPSQPGDANPQRVSLCCSIPPPHAHTFIFFCMHLFLLFCVCAKLPAISLGGAGVPANIIVEAIAWLILQRALP